MNGFLLDTNIPSELTRPRPELKVYRWLDDADDDRLYFSVVSLGEILKGISILPVSSRRRELQWWLDETLRPWFQGRILPVNEPIAERWGLLAGECQLKGRRLKVADGFIAATALEHDLTIVTRNIKDFYGLGVRILNPWGNSGDGHFGIGLSQMIRLPEMEVSNAVRIQDKTRYLAVWISQKVNNAAERLEIILHDGSQLLRLRL